MNSRSKSVALKSQRIYAVGASAASLALFATLLISSVAVPSQTPPANPQEQKDRGVGLETDQTTTPNSEQKKQTGVAPELVLQTGYTAANFVQSLIYSPNGRILATTAMNSNQVKLWDTGSGFELRTLAISGGVSGFGAATLSGIASISFSHDGRLLAAGGRDGSISIWEVGP